MARGLETFLAVLVLGALPAPGAADPLLREFAVCAGRLSAVMEDQWMFDGPGSEKTAMELAAATKIKSTKEFPISRTNRSSFL